jgi:hypothetical protein
MFLEGRTRCTADVNFSIIKRDCRKTLSQIVGMWD